MFHKKKFPVFTVIHKWVTYLEKSSSSASRIVETDQMGILGDGTQDISALGMKVGWSELNNCFPLEDSGTLFIESVLVNVFPLVLNVGNITENFSKKICLTNAMDEEKQRGIGCNISLQFQSWQIFIEKMHSSFFGTLSHCEFIPWSFVKCLKDCFYYYFFNF